MAYSKNNMKYLLIFYNDSSSVLFRLKNTESSELAFSKALKRHEKKLEDVKVRFELDASELPSEFYLPCVTLNKDNELIFNTFSILSLHMIGFWIPMRNSLLKKLDIEYMRADENGDAEKKKFIARRKDFLRDMPDFMGRTPLKAMNLRINFENPTDGQAVEMQKAFNLGFSKEKALKITPFYNIFDIEIQDPGSGYTQEPEITIECDSEVAFHPILKTEIENGKIKKVTVISPGCGYTSEPVIKVSAPETPNGRVAALSTTVEYKLSNFNHGLAI